MSDLSDATIDELVDELVSRDGIKELSHNGKLDGEWMEVCLGRGIYTVIVIESDPE